MKKYAKKYRRQRRKGFQFKYLAMVIGGFLVIGAAFLFLRGGGAAATPVSGGTPAISVDPASIDYGDLKDYTVKKISIKVTNTGTGALRFTEAPYIEVVKGCCPPTMTAGREWLNPGESTTLTSAEFFMHPGMDGYHDFAVHVKTNDPAQPDKVVHVLSNWSQ
jgi:hypothetical protein